MFLYKTNLRCVLALSTLRSSRAVHDERRSCPGGPPVPKGRPVLPQKPAPALPVQVAPVQLTKSGNEGQEALKRADNSKLCHNKYRINTIKN